jgi:hypothetical protein
MGNEELVLIFATFLSKDYHQYKGGGIKRYLNEYMRQNQNLDQQGLFLLEKQFKKSVDLTKHVFGDKAFRIFSMNKNSSTTDFDTRKINQGLYMIIMYWFAIYEKNQIVPYADLIREEMLSLQIHNDEFIESLTGSGTNSKDAMILKFDVWGSNLKNILGYPASEPRAFSYELKRQLFNNNNICSLCGQQIHNIDDSEIDHITCYSNGGKTIPQNARLTHRYCNRKRGNTPEVEGFNNVIIQNVNSNYQKKEAVLQKQDTLSYINQNIRPQYKPNYSFTPLKQKDENNSQRKERKRSSLSFKYKNSERIELRNQIETYEKFLEIICEEYAPEVLLKVKTNGGKPLFSRNREDLTIEEKTGKMLSELIPGTTDIYYNTCLSLIAKKEAMQKIARLYGFEKDLTVYLEPKN